MQKVSTKGSSNSPWGKKLPKGTDAIEFTFEYDAYDEKTDKDEFLNTKGAPLTVEEQMKVRNNEALNAERNKAQQKAWIEAGYPKPDPKTDKQLQLKAIYKALMLSGMFTEKQARQTASDNLGGLAWEDTE